MNQDVLLYHVKDHIATLTINREANRNSINSEVISLFNRFLDEAENDHTVRAILITGSGDKAFCSGADLGDLKSGRNDSGGNPISGYANLLKRISKYPKPTVARINGYCLAGGMGFMLSCDIVVARNDARFGTPEVNVGLFPMMIGALIFRNASRKKAMEMILLGEKLSAQDARDMGLITRAVPPQDLDAEVDNILQNLKEKSPIGMKIGKEAFFHMADMPLEKALDYLSEKLMDVASTEDAVEGLTAFLEKRKPEFKGK
ncbi:MAG: enoyl-CoA hydratase/isomerase family protein [Proteobacteria bacterium]|nr:enoyl-CoA hydratase/isomerase family protein [Pseudomonadota bacterium]